MTEGPSVSLIIVSNARPDALALTLKALEYQRYAHFEVIVVSDLEPATRPASRLEVRWIDFADRNISVARNLGLAAARGSLVAFCDDDAVPEFGWLAALVEPFARDDVGAAGGFTRGRNGVSYQWKAVEFDRTGADYKIEVPSDRPTVFAPRPDRFPKTVGTNCAFRRDALSGIGGFDGAYRFFLDEADVNLRLAQDGWSAAIVPGAEVLHGFAKGPHRTARRVPTSLFEIGASLAHFLAQHATEAQIAARLDAFRAEQRKRLLQHHGLGLLDGPALRMLLGTLEDGFRQGAERKQQLSVFAADPGPFVATPRPANGQRQMILADGLSPTAALAEAAATAKTGTEVTVLRPEPTHRALVVGFQPQGYFLHRFGLLGRSDRAGPRRFARTSRRIKDELRRIQTQRGLIL